MERVSNNCFVFYWAFENDTEKEAPLSFVSELSMGPEHV